MSDLERGNYLTNDRISLDDTTRHAAALHVCSRAADVDDAEQLLMALGLLDYTHDSERLAT